MNVLYDISNLGYGHRDAKHRTGIARVIESLAYALVAVSDCNITFCAGEYNQEAEGYVRSSTQLSHIPFISNGCKQWMLRTHDTLGQKLGTQAGVPSPALRALKKALYFLDRTVGQTAFPMSATAMKEADIYHSTFQPLPQQVKRSQLAKMLTIYDLIPILYPQYYGNDTFLQDFLKQAVYSLSPQDYALCISQATKNDFCSYTGHDPTRAFVTHLAADSALFYPCTDQDARCAVLQKYSLPDQPYLLSLSTLEPRKNIEHVIRCFVQLVKEQNIADLCLVLAGAKGWNYERVFAELDAAQDVKNRIIITGRVEDEDLAALYSGAMAFTYMSHYEGFGLPPLEAMQCGVPVITSNTSSLPEVVGDAGIMLDPNDDDGLCAAMLKLHQSEELRQEMSKKSLARAQQFSWERCGRETITAYKQALAR